MGSRRRILSGAGAVEAEFADRAMPQCNGLRRTDGVNQNVVSPAAMKKMQKERRVSFEGSVCVVSSGPTRPPARQQ